MDHSHMDHGHMDHGGMGHGGMDMGSQCKMSVRITEANASYRSTDSIIQMLFTWDTTDLCIIFPGWHVYSTFTLIISLLGVVLLTAGYELVRDASRRYESSSAEYMNSLPSK